MYDYKVHCFELDDFPLEIERSREERQSPESPIESARLDSGRRLWEKPSKEEDD
jgi:hypothetical protein